LVLLVEECELVLLLLSGPDGLVVVIHGRVLVDLKIISLI